MGVERRPLSQAVLQDEKKLVKSKHSYTLLMQSDYFTYFTSSINPLKDPRAASEENHQIIFDNHSLANDSESHKFECPPIVYRDLKGPIKTRNNMKFRQLFGLTTRAAQTNDSTQQQTKDTTMISRSEFDKKYTTCSLLGKGGFGAVYAGYRNTDHFPVAIKVINKNRIMSSTTTTNSEHRIPMEVALMKITNHIEGVIKLIEYFELPDCFMLIMERMMTTKVHSSGRDIKTSSSNVKDLFDFISDNGPLKEELAKKIFRQLIETVQKIHAAGVIHRDIKDENILIDTQTHNVKIIDLVLVPGSTMKSTLISMAPGSMLHLNGSNLEDTELTASLFGVWASYFTTWYVAIFLSKQTTKSRKLRLFSNLPWALV